VIAKTISWAKIEGSRGGWWLKDRNRRELYVIHKEGKGTNRNNLGVRTIVSSTQQEGEKKGREKIFSAPEY